MYVHPQLVNPIFMTFKTKYILIYFIPTKKHVIKSSVVSPVKYYFLYCALKVRSPNKLATNLHTEYI